MIKIVLSNSQGPIDTRRCHRVDIADTVAHMVHDNVFGVVKGDVITIEVES